MKPYLKPQRSDMILLIIDIQEGLLKAMDEKVGKEVVRNVSILMKFSKEMGIPIVSTEQYPKGLGKTVAEISGQEGFGSPIEKLSFSCARTEVFREAIARHARRQIVLTGMETHVCVLQTADDLLEGGYTVYVIADATCSRKKLDWQIGLRWMEKKGARVTTTEILAFQLLEKAGTEEFRRLSRLLR